MSAFDLSAYLDRVRLDPVPATLEGLRALQRAQLRAIPFESIDPYLGVIPATDPEAIADKIVRRGRGGYCFELNALLGGAMVALGFDTERRLARVRKGAPRGGTRSHLALVARIDGRRYLADAGYGGPGPLLPLELDSDAEQQVPNGAYRLWDDPETGERVLDKKTPEGWFPLYGFDSAHVGDMDIAGANVLCATWDALPFSNHLMLAGFDGETRIGVFDCAVTLDTPGGETRQRLDSHDAFTALVCDQLKISLDKATLRRVWSRLAARDALP